MFFLRDWRQWLQYEGFSIAENFITLNAFTCVELNAHTLIAGMRRLRSQGRPELFLPFLWSSQPCEQAFRDMRSQTGVN